MDDEVHKLIWGAVISITIALFATVFYLANRIDQINIKLRELEFKVESIDKP